MFAIHLVFAQLAQEFLCAFFASSHRGGGHNRKGIYCAGPISSSEARV